jgi:hypothetical protein
MSECDFTNIANASISTPAAGVTAAFVDLDKKLKTKNDAGAITVFMDSSFQSIATAGGTTTFTNQSPQYTIFTGTSGQTVVLPDATTLSIAQSYQIDNDSTVAVTVNANGGGAVWIVAPNGGNATIRVTNVGTAAGAWDVDYLGINISTGKMLSVSSTLTLAGTDGQTFTFPATTGAVITDTNAQTISAAKTFSAAIIPSQTIGITGTTTNNAAQAGAVGEIITAIINTPGTSLTTATPANVITTPFLSLTAGDWDVWGEVCFLPAATTSITQIAAGINSVSATLPAAGSGLTQETHAALVPGAIPQCFDVVERRVSIAGTTPYYLVAQAAFTISTLTVFGTLYARRRR